MPTSIKNVTNEHESWKNTLAFYKDEIKIFRNRLDEVAQKNNMHPIIEQIEKFQNQLDIQDSKISELRHEIDQYVHQLSAESQSHAGHVSTATIEKFTDLKQKTEQTTLLFVAFKIEFRDFIEKVF